MNLEVELKSGSKFGQTGHSQRSELGKIVAGDSKGVKEGGLAQGKRAIDRRIRQHLRAGRTASAAHIEGDLRAGQSRG